VAYGNGAFIVKNRYNGSHIPQILYTTDLLNWTTVDTNPAQLYSSFAGKPIAYGNGSWVIGHDPSIVLGSTNGITWVTENFNQSQTIYSVAYGNGNFVMSYGASMSKSPQTIVNAQSKLKSVIYGNNNWLGVGDYGQIAYSVDKFIWTTISYTTDDIPLNSIGHDGTSTFVVVGNSGKLYRSVNGLNWVSYNSTFGSTNINSITFGGNNSAKAGAFNDLGIWVVVGDSGHIRKSINSIAWTTMASLSSSNFISIASGYSPAYNSNSFLTISSNLSSRMCTDGVTWFTGPTFSSIGPTLYSVTYGNGIWMVGGSNGAIAVSSNMVNWTTRSIDFFDVKSISYGNNLWIAATKGGAFKGSTDTITWTTKNNYPKLNQEKQVVKFANNEWISVDISGNIAYSPQLYKTGDYTFNYNMPDTDKTGNNYLSNTPSSNLVTRMIGYGNGMWVGGSNSRNTLSYSTDLISWTDTAGILANGLDNFAFGNGYFVARSNYQDIKKSTNGINWSAASTWATGPASGATIYGNGIWFDYTSGTSTGKFSTDLINWTIISVPTQTLRSMTYKNNTWVIGGDANIAYSNDLFNWNTSAVTVGNTFNSVNQIDYANGIWAIIGRHVKTSTNLITWVTSLMIDVGGTNADNYIFNYNNLWQAYLYYGTTDLFSMKSTDTISWSTMINAIPTTGGSQYTINGVAYGQDTIVLLVNQGQTFVRMPQYYKSSPTSIKDVNYSSTYWVAGTGGALYNSTDAITWTTNNPNTFNNSDLNVIKYGGTGTHQAYFVGGV
jgi:hypothetical protein